MTLLPYEFFLKLAGGYLAVVALHVALDREHPRRWGSAAFWGVLAGVFAAGNRLPPVVVGYAVLGLAALVGARQVGAPRWQALSAEAARAEAARLGNRLLAPVIAVPLLVVTGTLALPHAAWGDVALVESRHATQVALGLACLLALALALRVTQARAVAPAAAGSHLLQAIGWALILPQLLAALGGIFAQAGVGQVVADHAARWLPTGNPLVAVVAYCAGMAAFTIVMGNAFAAFPVITLGIGLPFIVQQHGGNPAIMGALGMLSGYCGTLATPMAANFNIVPAVLLELEDKNAVIKAQLPMAAAIWSFNVAVMYFCVYRF